MDVDAADFRVQRMPRRFFGSAAAHGALLGSPVFYEAFADYDYVLIHHLDAFVFSDQLREWCARGYDYIGPAWFTTTTNPPSPRVAATGGFSLRRINACLSVLRSRVRGISPADYWRATGPGGTGRSLVRRLLGTAIKSLPRFNDVAWEMKRFLRDRAEDDFWAFRASHYDEEFALAPASEGLAFGWGLEPRLCFELRGGALPFGCHGWSRPENRDFWLPLLRSHA